MSLRQKVPAILKYIDQNQSKLRDNSTILSMLEGDVQTQIFKKIEEQLSGESQKVSKQRAVPINLLRKVVDKLSSLYNDAPERVVTGASNVDLVEMYENSLNIDDQFNSVNESFNAYKYGAQEFYYDPRSREIRTRTLPTNMFLPYGDDPMNPLRMTVMIKFMGSRVVKKGYTKDLFSFDADGTEAKNKVKTVSVYHLISDDEFLAIGADGKAIASDMVDNEDGINPYGVIPFGYVSRSKFDLVPTTDTDTIAMSVLLPLLMTEINYGMMFLANPIIYGVDLDVSNLQVAPLAFWSIKSDGSTENQAKIDVLRPEMNIPNQSDWIKEQLALWLESKNIRASHLTNLGGDQAASGIALMIREMDTTEDRKKQATYFTAFERESWNVLSKVHNALAGSGKLKENRQFTNDFEVKAIFAPNKAIEDKNEVYTRTTQAYQAGVISKRRALKVIFPEWTTEEIEEELNESTFTPVNSSIVVDKSEEV